MQTVIRLKSDSKLKDLKKRFCLLKQVQIQGLSMTVQLHSFETKVNRESIYYKAAINYELCTCSRRFSKKPFQSFSASLQSKTSFVTAQKMKFFIRDFFSKYDQIHSFLRIWSQLLKKTLMENFIFCAVCGPLV